jgi:hypothetical protein
MTNANANQKLRKIDEQGEILAGLLKAQRISPDRYTAALRKLVARAEAILAGMAN